ncbi:MAG: hypothetical protein RL190_2065 [Actinomycetota bacterium]|jgi:hypothetical protein
MTSLIGVLAISVACIAVSSPRIAGRPWPPALLSAAAGVSLAYFVVHQLPEAANATVTWEFTREWSRYDDLHAYLFLLGGVVGTLVLRFAQRGEHGFAARPRIAYVEPTLAALLVGYVMAGHAGDDVLTIGLFAIAVGLHLAIGAHGLSRRFASPFAGAALTLSLLIGLGIGSLTSAPVEIVAGMSALLAGGVMTTVVSELGDGQRHFAAFVAGVLLETVLIAVAL